MKKALIAGVVVVLLAIAAVFIYAKIEDNSAPAKLSLGDRKTSTTVAAPESLDGDW